MLIYNYLTAYKENIMAKRIVRTTKKGANVSEVTATGEALMKNFPWTIQGIADELDMPLSSFRVWKNKMEKDKKLPRPKVGSLLCQHDPSSKLILRFSDKYFDNIKELRDAAPKRNKREQVSKASLEKAILKIMVPIFDPNVADILLKKFKDENGIQQYFKDQVRLLTGSVMSRLEEIKKRQREEIEQALANL